MVNGYFYLSFFCCPSEDHQNFPYKKKNINLTFFISSFTFVIQSSVGLALNKKNKKSHTKIIMMKSIIVFIALCVAATLASPPHLTRSEPEPVHILRYESDNIGVGPYNYA